jgi:hypothetical protein
MFHTITLQDAEKRIELTELRRLQSTTTTTPPPIKIQAHTMGRTLESYTKMYNV